MAILSADDQQINLRMGGCPEEEAQLPMPQHLAVPTIVAAFLARAGQAGVYWLLRHSTYSQEKGRPTLATGGPTRGGVHLGAQGLHSGISS
jgi:hypothetical protein